MDTPRRVNRTQELRRSGAAGPHKNSQDKRAHNRLRREMDDIVDTCILCGSNVGPFDRVHYAYEGVTLVCLDGAACDERVEAYANDHK